MSKKVRVLVLIFVGCLVGALLPTAGASNISHPTTVSEDAVNHTPQLVLIQGDPKPITDAIAQVGGTTFIGGRFQRITQGGTFYNRVNIAGFNTSTGAVSAFAPSINGRVWALASFGGSLYVGGQFTSVNGEARRNLFKINPDGTLDQEFRANIGGRVNALVVANGQLYVGGSFGAKVAAVSLTTGLNTGAVNLAITDPIPGAWGNVTVHAMAINPAGTRLIATGNFQTVQGQSRVRFFMANLTTPGASLDPYYYDPFRFSCVSVHPRRIAYLQGVDFSPDGSYFVVVATGQVSRTFQIGVTVCDAAARFNMNNDDDPVWINYTGGDSMWSTAVTGSTVYVQGHFRWLDNPYGRSSEDGGGAAQRYGIGAIHPTTGLALPWNPPKRSSIGGRAFLVTPDGLWIGSDSARFGTEAHRGLAFAPLP